MENPNPEMGSQKCAVIISCFPGLERSRLHGQTHDGKTLSPAGGKYTILDVDSMVAAADTGAGAARPKEEQEDYWQVVDELTWDGGRGAVVLVTASGPSHGRLLARGLRFVCVYPGVDIKKEYMRRYFDRYGLDATWRALYRYWEDKIRELGLVKPGEGGEENNVEENGEENGEEKKGEEKGPCIGWELAVWEDLEDVLPYILTGVKNGAI